MKEHKLQHKLGVVKRLSEEHVEQRGHSTAGRSLKTAAISLRVGLFTGISNERGREGWKDGIERNR